MRNAGKRSIQEPANKGGSILVNNLMHNPSMSSSKTHFADIMGRKRGSD